ncbi:ferric-dicitrate binding protein FerR (iron transport regulator) [Chitinophaga dinghuensis]|uniref:Ferric-dicitrate binding protein FerR (Iron transport regulator) n=1 Tax=Chitinophaga dinghuensis TaxID=1539050 RepID=A0A327VLH9_9BACT|nr:FecR domain-containing protein [Chitinophaga dinghuensis]RAJ73711.1 ferric-dicitrate binding protein FerR (iron transport regulator) [Chitinophaga dinghuensis]
MQEDNIIQRIDSYLSGQATPEEEKALQQWFDELHMPPVDDSMEDKVQLGERMYTAISDKLGLTPAVKKLYVKRSTWWKLAASVLSAAIVTAGGLLYKNRMPQRTPVAKLIDVYTRKGQLTKIILTDSSIVWLNANSHFRYPEQFGTDRTVYLQGEAYFDIRQDPAHPFTIESNGYRTQVLGTTFSIRSYPAPNVYRVTVATGKVMVCRTQDSSRLAVLTANQEFRFNGNDSTELVRSVHAASLLAWKEGKLTFEKDQLSEVLVSLENRYGQRLVLQSKHKATMEISGTFDRNQSLNDVLHILSKVYGLRQKKQTDGTICII